MYFIMFTDLTNEDLTDDVACAKKVFDQLGFLGWEGWKRSCYKRTLYDVSRCYPHSALSLP